MRNTTANIQPAANRKGLRYEHPRKTHWRCIGGMSGSAIGSGKSTSSDSTSRVLMVCDSKDSMALALLGDGEDSEQFGCHRQPSEECVLESVSFTARDARGGGIWKTWHRWVR